MNEKREIELNRGGGLGERVRTPRGRLSLTAAKKELSSLPMGIFGRNTSDDGGWGDKRG